MPGPNRVAEDLEGVPHFECLSVIGTVEETLSYVGANFRSSDTLREYTLVEAGEQGATAPTMAAAASENLVRLALFESVRAAIRSGDRHEREAAALLAAENRLVTPLSGAVVLETRQQYLRHGLAPPPGTPESRVPAVPEPHEWALIAVALAVFCFLIVRPSVRAVGIRR